MQAKVKILWKQPLFYGACICFVIAITLAVIGIIHNPRESIIARLEAGINKNKPDKVISCMTPDNQAALTSYFGLTGNVSDMLGFDGGKIHIVTSSSIPKNEEFSENEYLSVNAYVISYDESGQYRDTFQSDFDIVIIDNKKYIN